MGESLLLALLLWFWIPLVLSQTLIYGLQNQHPPVARANAPFQWSFQADSFQDASSYSAQGLPDWCAFDAQTLTFAGFPSDSDVGSSWITVQANSSDGSSAQDGFFLLVSDDKPPSINLPIQKQLPGAVTLDPSYVDVANNALHVPPGWSFSLGLAPSTFSTSFSGQSLFYTAFQNGSTSLPSWLSFDNTTLTFGSSAVPVPAHNSSGATSYDITLAASDNFGYADIRQYFSIVVGNRTLSLSIPFPSINATSRTDVNYTFPVQNIQINGDHAASTADVKIVPDLSNVSFLSYDPLALSITGKLPSTLPDSADVSFPVNISSTFGSSSLLERVTLHVIPNIFVAQILPDVIVHPGLPFSFDLGNYAADINATYRADVDPPEAYSWVSFSPIDLKLTGNVPSGIQSYSDVTVHFDAFDQATSISDSSRVTLRFSTLTNPPPSKDAEQTARENTLRLAIGLTFGILAGLIVLILIWKMRARFCFCGERKNRRERGISSRHMRKDTDARSSYSQSSVSTVYEKASFYDEMQRPDDKPRRHNIILVTDGKGGTYEVDDDDDNVRGVTLNAAPSSKTINSRHQSTFRSFASSSLFYSDRDSPGGVSVANSPTTPDSFSSPEEDLSPAVSRGGDKYTNARKSYNRRPNALAPPSRSRSTPRQRSDFKPILKHTQEQHLPPTSPPTRPPPPVPTMSPSQIVDTSFIIYPDDDPESSRVNS